MKHSTHENSAILRRNIRLLNVLCECWKDRISFKAQLVSLRLFNNEIPNSFRGSFIECEIQSFSWMYGSIGPPVWTLTSSKKLSGSWKERRVEDLTWRGVEYLSRGVENLTCHLVRICHLGGFLRNWYRLGRSFPLMLWIKIFSAPSNLLEFSCEMGWILSVPPRMQSRKRSLSSLP